MPFNARDFQAYIADTGVLQTNKYDVQITLDGTLGGLSISGTDGSTMNVNSGTDDMLYRDRKSTRLNSSHIPLSRMPSSA